MSISSSHHQQIRHPYMLPPTTRVSVADPPAHAVGMLPMPGSPHAVATCRAVLASALGSRHDLLVRHLTRHGYRVEQVAVGATLSSRAADADVVLVAGDLEEVDVPSVCAAVRSVTATPLLVVGGPDSEIDRVLTLRAGADDHLSAPYGERELVARIEAVLRRAGADADAVGEVVERGPLRIDLAARTVAVRGGEVDLTRKEFELLALLVSRSETVVTRRELMVEVWGDDWASTSRTIDTHVGTLRSKLGLPGAVVTVRGVGFRFSCPRSDSTWTHS